MGWVSIDIQCTECGKKWDDLVDRTEQENFFLCGDCGKVAGKKALSTPTIMKAAYPDGKRRFTDMKEAARLKAHRSQESSRVEREKMSAEIKKLGVKDYIKKS